MKPNHWLKKFAPGFDQLSAQERKAIKDFSLLWSVFEGTILDTNANAKTIICAVRSLSEQGKLTLKPFRAAIKYFSDRYYDGINLTSEFERLAFRGGDHKPLVEKVLRGRANDDVEILSAILIIVLRLRNNLFHGIKWSYGVQGQLANFRNANNVLISVMMLYQP